MEEGRTGSSHVVVPRVERQVAQRGAAQMVFDRHALGCTRPSRHAAGSDSPQAHARDTPVATPQSCPLHSSRRQAYAACQAHNMASETKHRLQNSRHATCTCTADRIPHKRRPRDSEGPRPACERGAWNSRARLRSDTEVPRSSQSVPFTSATALPAAPPVSRLSIASPASDACTTVRTSSGPKRQESTAARGPRCLVGGACDHGRMAGEGGRGREGERGRERERGGERGRRDETRKNQGPKDNFHKNEPTGRRAPLHPAPTLK